MSYNRQAAVNYAHTWAMDRNPAYYDFEKIGGDCTNFASQCIFAGVNQMNHTPTYGWYYHSANDKSPSWTGVQYLYQFLTRSAKSAGPHGVEIPISQVMPGDLAQLSFDGVVFRHSPFIVSVGETPTLDNILIGAHTYDCDNRPLSTYQFEIIRFLHLSG